MTFLFGLLVGAIVGAVFGVAFVIGVSYMLTPLHNDEWRRK